MGRVADSTSEYNRSYMGDFRHKDRKRDRGKRRTPRYNDFSSTSRTYSHVEGTSKITVRLSTDGSMLEIEQCDFQSSTDVTFTSGDTSPRPHMYSRCESAPLLNTRLDKSVDWPPVDSDSMSRSTQSNATAKGFTTSPIVKGTYETGDDETHNAILQSDLMKSNGQIKNCIETQPLPSQNGNTVANKCCSMCTNGAEQLDLCSNGERDGLKQNRTSWSTVSKTSGYTMLYFPVGARPHSVDRMCAFCSCCLRAQQTGSRASIASGEGGHQCSVHTNVGVSDIESNLFMNNDKIKALDVYNGIQGLPSSENVWEKRPQLSKLRDDLHANARNRDSTCGAPMATNNRGDPFISLSLDINLLSVQDTSIQQMSSTSHVVEPVSRFRHCGERTLDHACENAYSCVSMTSSNHMTSRCAAQDATILRNTGGFLLNQKYVCEVSYQTA